MHAAMCASSRRCSYVWPANRCLVWLLCVHASWGKADAWMTVCLAFCSRAPACEQTAAVYWHSSIGRMHGSVQRCAPKVSCDTGVHSYWWWLVVGCGVALQAVLCCWGSSCHSVCVPFSLCWNIFSTLLLHALQTPLLVMMRCRCCFACG